MKVATTWSLLLLVSCATVSPTKAEALAGQSLAAVGQQYRTINLGLIEGCVERRFPTKTCQAWADFSREFTTAFDPLSDAYLAGTEPSGPEWKRLVAGLGSFGAQLLTLKAARDGGAP